MDNQLIVPVLEQKRSQIGENSVGGQIPGGGRYLRNAENLAVDAVSLRESVNPASSLKIRSILAWRTIRLSL